MMGRMGPKISSCMTGSSGLTPVNGGGDVELLLVHLAANHGLALRGGKKT